MLSEKVKAKQPWAWEMTKDEWIKTDYANIQKTADRFDRLTKEEQDKALKKFRDEVQGGKIVPNDRKAANEFYYFKKTGDIVGDDYPTHEAEIKYALKFGDLTFEQYKALHEPDYGPIEEFAPEMLES